MHGGKLMQTPQAGLIAKAIVGSNLIHLQHTDKFGRCPTLGAMELYDGSRKTGAWTGQDQFRMK